MSRFYATIEGSRGPATRQGTADSGMYGHVRGWSLGGQVRMRTAPQDSEQDMVLIDLTSGSGSGYGFGRKALADARDLGNGVTEVRLSEAFGGGVFHIDRNGNVKRKRARKAAA